MSLDETLRLLADERRREMIYALDRAETDSFTYDEVVDAVAENGGLPQDHRDRLEVEMTHVHLPKMDENGLIEYDEEEEVITYDPDEEIEELMDVVEEYD